MPYGQWIFGYSNGSIDMNALRVGCQKCDINVKNCSFIFLLMPYGQLHNGGGPFSIDMNALLAIVYGGGPFSIDMNALWAIA